MKLTAASTVPRRNNIMRKTERIARTVVNSNKSPEVERFIRVLGTIEGAELTARIL